MSLDEQKHERKKNSPESHTLRHSARSHRPIRRTANRNDERRSFVHLIVLFASPFFVAFLPPFFRNQLSVTYYCHFILYIRLNQRAEHPCRALY